ncbi:unnamed protein product [Rotaria magnacalcarata]|uniref:Uncharacterized protein n=1 Tax=Rotaria magnacalcarata TaxID=392030 RepID=A0A8S2US15_9BILA|nr:unnamed protein product [Rotaria magnacalcarata]CAF4359640.1 unnamed protein product [Rotaria magnacalcarata]
MKAKNRERMKNIHSKLSDFQREQYRNYDAAARKRIKVEGNIVDFTIKIQWLQRINNNGRAEKEESEETIKSCVQHLSSLIQQYLSYVFIKRAQSSLFEELKESTDDRKILLQIGYAENFAMDQQDAI